MDSSGILSLLEQLDDDLDDLEDSMEPFLKIGLTVTSSKLPVLDKAKLYVLTTYSIESILFSYLRLNNINAREQPVFKELTRVKQYFDKIKTLETPDQNNPAKLDRRAAERFIKAGLDSNNTLDLKRGKAIPDGVVSAHTKLQEDTKDLVDNNADGSDIVSDQVDVSCSELEDLISNAAISPRKRKVVDSDRGSSLSHCGSDAEARKERRKRTKEELKKATKKKPKKTRT